MDTIKLTIDGKNVEVKNGSTILDAAKAAGINIPTLCYHMDLEKPAVCRVCVVEIEGDKLLQPSCAYPAREGMVVRTNTPQVREARKMAVELLLARHPDGCLECIRNQNCELQTLAETLGIREIRFERKVRTEKKDESARAIIRDPEKCILCRRCVSMCQQIQGVGILFPSGRGVDTLIVPELDKALADVACVQCGQCINVCPVGAIYERDDTDKVWAALASPNTHVVVQTAPATRVSIGEEMGMEPGSVTTGQMVAGLRKLGFDKVFDTDFSADLTILEEGNELLKRIETDGPLPLITSCSPGWIKYIEHFYPELLELVSTCKSPQQMFGALAKTYYADKCGVKPEDIFVVSIMPCTAKKYESDRPEMASSGFKDVDVVLTVRELGRMFRQAGIDFASIDSEEYDEPLGISTGAGAIFGATGGVMEAALRTVYEVVMQKELETLDFYEVRGLDGVKEAAVDLNGLTVKVAVAHGLGNAKKVLDKVKAKEADYHFIEIMCCPGGCIGGGGQPIPTDTEIRKKRIEAIYAVDQEMSIRKSHKNPAIEVLYEEFLKAPLGEKSHELLHTHYTPRDRY
jgi:NADP-reducing hydrogenase subunit HndD